MSSRSARREADGSLSSGRVFSFDASGILGRCPDGLVVQGPGASSGHAAKVSNVRFLWRHHDLRAVAAGTAESSSQATFALAT